MSDRRDGRSPTQTMQHRGVGPPGGGAGFGGPGTRRPQAEHALLHWRVMGGYPHQKAQVFGRLRPEARIVGEPRLRSRRSL